MSSDNENVLQTIDDFGTMYWMVKTHYSEVNIYSFQKSLGTFTLVQSV